MKSGTLQKDQTNNNRNRDRRRILAQWPRKDFQQNHRTKLFQPKERHAYNIKEANRTPIRLDQKRKSSYHIIIKTKSAEQRKNIKSSKGKMSSNK